MLKNRSRNVTKQPLMSDHAPLSSPLKQNPNRPVSSFIGSPRLFFNGFFTSSNTNLSDSQVVLSSPTSVLQGTKHLSSSSYLNKSINPSNPADNFSRTPKLGFEGIGIVLIEEKINENVISKPNARKAPFGSELAIKIPVLPRPGISPSGSPDYGTKTHRNPPSTPTGLGAASSCCVGTRSPLSRKEMELSEEYTCVISRGPNPKTTHIYDDCMVESQLGTVWVLSELKAERIVDSPSRDFLGHCCTCKKGLGVDIDVYAYRGEGGFCSEECRSRETVLDAQRENSTAAAGHEGL